MLGKYFCVVTFLGTIVNQVDAQGGYPLTIVLYDGPNLTGNEQKIEFKDDSYISLANTGFDNITASFLIVKGSCVQMFTTQVPSYEPGSRFYSQSTRNLILPAGFSGKISSIKKCFTKHVSMFCPSGTIARKIRWDASTKLCGGIEMHCYSIKDLSSLVKILKSNAKSSLDQNSASKECPNGGFPAINLQHSDRLGTEFEMNPVCSWSEVKLAEETIYVGSGTEPHEIDKDTIRKRSEYCVGSSEDPAVVAELKLEIENRCESVESFRLS